jgi:hypothetical protein
VREEIEEFYTLFGRLNDERQKIFKYRLNTKTLLDFK